MASKVCEACGLYAAGRGVPLCGNCCELKPQELQRVREAAKMREQMAAKKMDATALVAELQQENMQLKADLEAKSAELEALKAPKSKDKG